MKVIYKCGCMPEEATIEVRNREDGEDIADWMQEVQRALGTHHHVTRPFCRSDKTEYVKIPWDDQTQPIGVPPKLSS